jgi:hypothetical protein
MLDGNYPTAIAVLREALAAAPAGGLTSAYALFDLARSLRLAGNPQAAIPYLEQRLQIPNQTRVVHQELVLALRAIGLQQMGTVGIPVVPPGHIKHGNGHGSDGGDGGD